MAAEAELIALFDGDGAGEIDPLIEKGQHLDGLGRADRLYLRIDIHDRLDARGVVGLDMVDDKIIGPTAVKGVAQIGDEPVLAAGVDRIDDGDLLVKDYI